MLYWSWFSNIQYWSLAGFVLSLINLEPFFSTYDAICSGNITSAGLCFKSLVLMLLISVRPLLFLVKPTPDHTSLYISCLFASSNCLTINMPTPLCRVASFIPSLMKSVVLSGLSVDWHLVRSRYLEASLDWDNLIKSCKAVLVEEGCRVLGRLPTVSSLPFLSLAISIFCNTSLPFV